MRARLFSPQRFRSPARDEKRLNVVVIYEGIQAGQRAMEVYTHLVNELSSDLQFRSTLYSFSLLSEPIFAKQAAERAAQAELLIVAAAGHTPLPETVKAWIEDWLATRGPIEAALVGMAGTPSLQDASDSPLQLSLKQLVRDSGVRYFPGNFLLAPEDAAPVENVSVRPQIVSPDSDDVPKRSRISRWGLNE